MRFIKLTLEDGQEVYLHPNYMSLYYKDKYSNKTFVKFGKKKDREFVKESVEEITKMLEYCNYN